jgi:pimeloyl-[acyl-carrier protein] methyl ester esterase
LHIETRGSGPDVVLIHGWAMHGGIFSSLTERLAARCRVHVVDLPGHGYSRAERFPGVDACAQVIAQALPRALWVGWSLGGLVALRGALDHAHAVRGVALIAASPRFVTAPDWPHGVDAGVFAAFDADLRERHESAIERFLALETMGSAHAQADLRDLRQRVFAHGEPDLDALAAGLVALDTTDLRGRLGSLAVPSLWIAGRRDRLVPPAAMAWSAAHSPGGRYLECNSGHAPFLSHAHEIAEALLAFATELPA